MWFKHRKEYPEAYLELKKGRVLEKEKVTREELGSEDKVRSSEENFEVLPLPKPRRPERQPDEPEQDEPENTEADAIDDADVSYEESEDNRHVPAPKGKKKWLILIFWLLFVLSALPVFIPFVRGVLDRPVDYNFELPSFSLSRADRSDTSEAETSDTEVAGESDVEPEATPQAEVVEQVTEQIQQTAPDVIESAQSLVSHAQDELRQDDLRSYARAHRIILENAEHIRNTTQRYVTRQGHYVEMRALEGRIHTEMSRARLALHGTEETPLQANLMGRIERTDAIREEVKEWDRSTAPDAVNTFIRQENADVQSFIRLLESALEDEGRSYTLEDDIFRFD